MTFQLIDWKEKKRCLNFDPGTEVGCCTRSVETYSGFVQPVVRTERRITFEVLCAELDKGHAHIVCLDYTQQTAGTLRR